MDLNVSPENEAEAEFDDSCKWPRRLLHLPSMTSFPWRPGNTYNGQVEPWYYAISYTWGRFELKEGEQPDVKAISIKTPWRLPRIDPAHFTAEQFEKVILGLSTIVQPVDFLWLDIACIDQTPGSRQKDLEIGRQAVIFKGAFEVFAWLNRYEQATIHEWNLEFVRTVDLILETALSEKDPNYMGDLNRELSTDQNAGVEGLMKVIDFYASEPWFSSLWTLQEAFLRQETILLCKEGWPWEKQIGEQPHIRIKDLVANFEMIYRALEEAPAMRAADLRWGVREHFHKTGLVGFLDCLPTVLWTAAQYRRVGPKRPHDRVYGIMQAFDLKLGKSAPDAEPGREYSLPELEDQLGAALLKMNPVISQLHVHNTPADLGKAWRIGRQTRVPFWVDSMFSLPEFSYSDIDHFKLTTQLSTQEYNGSTIGHLQGVSIQISDFVAVLTKLRQNVKYKWPMSLALDATSLVEPPLEIVQCQDFRSMDRYHYEELATWLAEKHPQVRVVLLARQHGIKRLGSLLERGIGMLVIPGNQRDTISYWRRIGICMWSLRYAGSQKNSKGPDYPELRCLEGHGDMWEKIEGMFG